MAVAEHQDPRIPRTRRAVCQAALTELTEHGFGAFSIESVAARSGVAKSTIYRHWDGKVALLLDALETINVQPPPLPDGETARDRVLALLHHLVTAMADPDLSGTTCALIDAAQRNEEISRLLHRYSDRRRQALVDAIAQGIADGELSASLDTELAALALSSPIIYRRVMTDRPFSHDQVGPLIDLVLDPTADG